MRRSRAGVLARGDWNLKITLTGVTLCMATEEQIQKVVNSLYDVESCNRCGTRLRFGDLDCPRCGSDIEDNLRDWAERLVDHLLDMDDEN